MCSNPKFFEIDQQYMSDPANCPLEQNNRKLLGEEDDQFSGPDEKFDASDFGKHAIAWLIISMLASIFVAVGFLHIVRHHAYSLARFTIAFQLAVPTTAALVLFLSGAFGQGLVALGFAALTFVVFYVWRNEIGVAAKLLSVAGHGLAENASLIGLTILLNIVGVLLALPPVVGAMFGYTVGDVVPNPLRQPASAECVDMQGNEVECCAWLPRQSAQAYIALSVLMALWTMLTLNQIRVYTVSGTVAQWYFTPSGSPITGNAARSLKSAVTTSLGTNIFAGLILTVTNMMKRQQQENQLNGEFSIVACLLSYLASFFEYLTKFATVFAAISGDALLTAGRRVTDLLMRSMLQAFATTVWFPHAVMSLASITLSALWGSAVWAGYRYLHHPVAGEKFPSTNALVLGILVGVVTMFVLSFLAGVLLSVLDAVFVCFAIDKDRRAVAHAEMYEALLGVVEERGILVENPVGGDVEYGVGVGVGASSPPTAAGVGMSR